MVICDVKFDTKYDQILRNPSHEPPWSSKYDCVLDAPLIILGSWKLAYNSIMTYYGYLWCQIWYQIWPNPPKLQSGMINVLQVWKCYWWTYNHARELKIWLQPRNDKLCWFMMSILISKTIKSSKTPVWNHQGPPSMTAFLMHF